MVAGWREADSAAALRNDKVRCGGDVRWAGASPLRDDIPLVPR